MSLWVTVDDVKDRWVIGDFPGTDAQIEKKIDDAEDIVLSRFPEIQGRIDSGALRESTVVRVVAGMVVRFFRNPEGLRTTGTTTGPFSETSSVTYGGDEPGELYLTDKDIADLSGITRRRAFTVPTYPIGGRW